MKKIIPLLILSMIFMAGCSLPFVKNETGEKTIQYIETNSSVVSASTNIDTLLLENLEKVTKEKELKNIDETINLVIQSKKNQQDLMKDLEIKESPEKAREAYKSLIHQRIMSYNHLIEVLTDENMDLLKTSIKNHQAKDSEIVDKTLKQINILLVENGGKEKKSLYKK